MSEPRTAQLVEATSFGGSRLMRFEMSDGKLLGFRGGQYVIVDTGLTLPDGKRRKRAFSMLSSDQDQHSFELGVRHVEGGLGSEWMLSLELGAELRFSGPWGKLSAPEANDVGEAWVIATDSGMSGALGLVRAQGFEAHLARTHFSWWLTSPEYFLSAATLSARLPACKTTRLETLPPVASAERLIEVELRVRALAEQGLPSRAYVVGDGRVATRVRECLVALGLEASVVQSESFFHHAVRKATSTQAA